MSARSRLVLITTCALLAMSGCTSSGPVPSVASASPSATTEQQLLAELPTTPVGAQMRWVLQTVAADSGPTAALVQQHFAASFLTQVPAARIIAVFAQVRSAGTLRLQEFTSSAPTNGQVSVNQAGKRLLISLDLNSAGQISGLSVKVAPSLPVVTSPASLESALTGLGVNASVLVADVGANGICRPRQALGDPAAHPLGSMFKLYVLGAVVRSIQAGKLSWTTQLTVTQAVKSLPSGQLQDAPVGTKVSVQDAAALMISISDNTAADLLIGAVGQAALADAVRAMGNSHPALLDPFPTTKQIFTLQYDVPALRSRWAALYSGLVSTSTGSVAEPPAATIGERAAILAQLPGATPTVTASNPRPGWLDGLEWYASPLDICRAQAALHQLAQTDAGTPVAAIMAKNPGVATGPGWSYVGYKGGSDAGVLTGSWFLQPSHGDTTVFVVQLSAANSATMPDDQWYAAATSGAIQHLPR